MRGEAENMEQITFDTTLTRTVQPRSCDRCYQRKSKCSRYSPCLACVACGSKCTYQRRPQFSNRVRSIRRAGLVKGQLKKKPGQLNGRSDDGEASYDGSEQSDAPFSPRSLEFLTTIVDHNGPTRLLWSQSEIDISTNVATALADLDPIVPGWREPKRTEAVPFADGCFSLNVVDGNINLIDAVSPFEQRNVVESINNNEISSSIIDNSTGKHSEEVPRLLYYIPSEYIWLPINLFLDRLHQSMPFFRRSYLVDNIKARRQEHDQVFGALIHAICAFALLQPVHAPDQVFSPDRAQMAEHLLAQAVHQHSDINLGEAPVLENVLTSVFLFACLNCLDNQNAARLRLKEAVSLAEIMRLDNPQALGNVTPDEEDRRVRTLLCLTIIHRVYAIQRDCSLSKYHPTSKGISTLQTMIRRCYTEQDHRELKGVIGLGHMAQLVDFIDESFIRCYKNKCRAGEVYEHVAPATVCSLLKRFSQPITSQQDPSGDAQRADLLITRHWIRHIIWNLGFRHGFMNESNINLEMRMFYALYIARDTIEACECFSIDCLEVHGIGLVEKLYDIVMGAIGIFIPSPKDGQSTRISKDTDTISALKRVANLQNAADETSAEVPEEVDEPSNNGLKCDSWLRDSLLRNVVNRFLVIFAQFRGGRHRFLKSYIATLHEMDIG